MHCTLLTAVHMRKATRWGSHDSSAGPPLSRSSIIDTLSLSPQQLCVLALLHSSAALCCLERSALEAVLQGCHCMGRYGRSLLAGKGIRLTVARAAVVADPRSLAQHSHALHQPAALQHLHPRPTELAEKLPTRIVVEDAGAGLKAGWVQGEGEGAGKNASTCASKQ